MATVKLPKLGWHLNDMPLGTGLPAGVLYLQKRLTIRTLTNEFRLAYRVFFMWNGVQKVGWFSYGYEKQGSFYYEGDDLKFPNI